MYSITNQPPYNNSNNNYVVLKFFTTFVLIEIANHMKHQRLLLVFAVLTGFSLLSCENKQQQREIAELKTRCDSLQVLTQMQDSSRAVIESYVETIALTLDSIKIQEQLLTVKVDENGRPLKKQEIKKNLDLLANVIKRQRERIELLEAQLLHQGVDSTSHYRTLISHLYDEIDKKNAQIEQMKLDIARQNQIITHLNTRVANLESDVEAISTHAKEQAETIAMQTEIMNAQNEQLNIGYLFIGTRKELTRAGILTKGLFTGGKLNASELDLSHFEQIDIREVHDVTCNSSRPKLLSSHPANSYEFIKNQDKTSTLVIKDPGAFWSLSNFLIIQL